MKKQATLAAANTDVTITINAHGEVNVDQVTLNLLIALVEWIWNPTVGLILPVLNLNIQICTHRCCHVLNYNHFCEIWHRISGCNCLCAWFRTAVGKSHFCQVLIKKWQTTDIFALWHLIGHNLFLQDWGGRCYSGKPGIDLQFKRMNLHFFKPSMWKKLSRLNWMPQSFWQQ